MLPLQTHTYSVSPQYKNADSTGEASSEICYCTHFQYCSSSPASTSEPAPRMHLVAVHPSVFRSTSMSSSRTTRTMYSGDLNATLPVNAVSMTRTTSTVFSVSQTPCRRKIQVSSKLAFMLADGSNLSLRCIAAPCARILVYRPILVISH
jgi:hypothetical protein